jgi:hypothetical protein
MITTIIEHAEWSHLRSALIFTSNCLHVPPDDVSTAVAVAYVIRHFKQGTYEGWEGFVEMLKADAR